MRAQRIAIAIILAGVVAGTLTLLLAALPELGCEGQPTALSMPRAAEREITAERAVRQVFVSPRNGLNRLDVYFQTYFRTNTHPVTVRLLQLAPGSDPLAPGTEQFSATFDPASLLAQGWRVFNFAPLPDSAGQTYAIVIESPESVPGNAVTVGGMIGANPYAPGPAFVGGVPLDGDIAFRACYQMSAAEKWQVFFEQLTHNRPGVWGSPGFYVILLVGYAALIVVLFGWLAKRVS